MHVPIIALHQNCLRLKVAIVLLCEAHPLATQICSRVACNNKPKHLTTISLCIIMGHNANRRFAQFSPFC